MKKAGKKFFYVLGLLVALLVAVLLYIGAHKESRNALLQKAAEKVDLQAGDVRYAQVDSSGMKWEIKAETVSYQKKEELALFEKVKAKVIMKDGRTFTISGDRGRLDTGSRDLKLEGNVVMASPDGDHFQTERLFYRDKLKRVETSDAVLMETGNIRINGVGMVLDLNKERATILSRVRAKTFVR